MSRAATVVMAGVACFGLLMPLALARKNPLLAAGLAVAYLLYAGVNVLLWQRMRARR